MEILQQPVQQVLTTHGKKTNVLCVFNVNRTGFGALLSVQKHCINCEDYKGIVTYPNNIILPRLLCSGSGHIKCLALYTSCSRYRRSVRCQHHCTKCEEFMGVDVSTGLIKCGKAKECLVSVLPFRNPKVDFPYSISCAKTQSLTTIDQCLRCHFFKGINGSRICCYHNKAVKSQYLTPKMRYKPLKPQTHRKIVSLKFLFEEEIKTISLETRVNCILDKTLNDCMSCSNFKGILPNQNIKKCRHSVDCKVFLHAVIYLMCPHSRGPVSLTVCSHCKQHQSFTFGDGIVKCSYTSLQGYVSNAPKKLKKEKYYYDFED